MNNSGGCENKLFRRPNSREETNTLLCSQIHQRSQRETAVDNVQESILKQCGAKVEQEIQEKHFRAHRKGEIVETICDLSARHFECEAWARK
jgi:hypothetical protein